MIKNVLIVFCFASLTAGCSHQHSASFTPENPLSAVDLQYQLKTHRRSLHQLHHLPQTPIRNSKGSFLWIYGSIISQSLSSGCDHYPSDSYYARIMFSQCSFSKAMVKTTARFLLESDAHLNFQNSVIEHHKIHFVHLPECAW